MNEADGSPDPTLFTDTVGQRLRSARERAGLDLNDVASRTRIPLRHLKSIEVSDYSQMPSPTYSVGFVKSYARAVGLDDAELGRDLRVELGTQSPLEAATAQRYEPVDPTRIAPKWLAWSAAALAVLLFGGYMVWRHLAANEVVPTIVEQAPVAGATDNAAAAGPGNAIGAVSNMATPLPNSSPNNTIGSNMSAAAPAVSAGNQPVILTATKTVWVRIYDANDKVLVEKEMKPGETYQVPADANNPQIRTGAAELINVTVGGKPVATLGKAQRTIKDVGVSAAALLARTAATSAPSSVPPSQAVH